MTQPTNQPLPPIRRIVTGHNNETKATIQLDSQNNARQAGHGPYITRLWASNEVPADLNVTATSDMGLLETGLSNNGSICRIVDFPPKSKGMVHRSMTLDYIYVVEGEVVLTLDDESRTVVGKGEVVVQRATMHGWDNEADSWARLLCILIAAEKPVVEGRLLDAEVPFQI
ncbi:cupin domain-containing protein [Aspergillus stella-maris]|uniref:cupin domain-containing protein n=1 Tax=Aspergillus stella-maris TaxID=1810926 RepID=UPI003CCD8E9B